MLKRVITIVLSLCLVLSAGVMAESVNQDMPQGMPEMRGERPSGGRGGMGMPQQGEMPEGFTPPTMPNGELPSGDFAPPEGFTPPQNAGGVAPQKGGETQSNENAAAPTPDNGNTNEKTPETAEETNQEQSGNMQFGENAPEEMRDFFANMQGGNMNTQAEQERGFVGFLKDYSTPVTSMVLLLFAYLFVIFYKRKHY